jgi:hypothetical protein
MFKLQTLERKESPRHFYIVRIGIPSTASECVPPPEPKGKGHTRLRGGGGVGPDSDGWRKSLALCLLCGLKYLPLMHCKNKAWHA